MSRKKRKKKGSKQQLRERLEELDELAGELAVQTGFEVLEELKFDRQLRSKAIQAAKRRRVDYIT